MQTEKPILPTVSLPVYFTLYLALSANEKHHKDERNIISLTSTDSLFFMWPQHRNQKSHQNFSIEYPLLLMNKLHSRQAKK